MADINLSPYTADQQAMNRRRRMAEAMQQQSITPIEMPTMPGVAISPYAGLAKILQGYIAGKNLSKADKEEKDYENKVSGETADFLSKMSQYETVPGDIISPAVPADITPAGTDIQENQARKNLIAYNVQNTKDGMRQIPINNAPNLATYEETYMPSSITDRIMQEAEDLPFKTTQDVINKTAVPEERGPSRQRPVLDASFLDPTKPYAYKTGQVKQMLMQVLMQQEAQKQAAAQRKQEAEQAIVKFGPEDTAGRIVNGVFKPIVTGVKQPKWEKSSTYDVNGREITGWVNTNAPNIPASFVKGAVKPEMTKAQQLDMAIKLFGTRVEAQRAIDEGRVPLTFDPAELDIKPLPPQGVALQTGVVYDTPKGRLRWNGNRFTSD
jgi:hypothetical protein